jgi:cytochrome c
MKQIQLAAFCIAASTMFAPCAVASEALAQKAGCAVCHAKDKKLLGPAYKDIATKYKADAGAVAKLAAIVRKGSQGVWGQVPMPPSDAAKISDSDLRTVLGWILKQ